MLDPNGNNSARIVYYQRRADGRLETRSAPTSNDGIQSGPDLPCPFEPDEPCDPNEPGLIGRRIAKL